MCYYFNPRSHEGSDFCAFCNSVMPFLFQSTLPRGERHSGEISEGNQSDFNPRSHEGSDNFYCPVHPIQCISIHAPTRGATTWNDQRAQCRRYFNPRSHEGSDKWTVTISDLRINFNPRSHEGSDSNFRQKVLFSLSKNCLKYLILTTNYFN